MAKLKETRVIREVAYPELLSNPVVVMTEYLDKLRMCIDFTNVNDVCPNDTYLTPPIDRLVDFTAGHTRLSFLNAYSGYHHIRMDLKDKEKTTLITHDGTYFCV